jgi:hypothetical protein
MYGTSIGWTWFDSGITLKPNEWHHVALTKRYTGSLNNSAQIYFDGQLAYTQAGSPYSTGSENSASSNLLNDPDNTWTYLGSRSNGTQRFNGYMDEVKVWKVARTQAEILEDMHSSDASSPSLQMYYDFNKQVGSTSTRVINLAYGGLPALDLRVSSATPYEDVALTTTSTPYTTITFPRSYITQYGGWKVPSNITTAS